MSRFVVLTSVLLVAVALCYADDVSGSDEPAINEDTETSKALLNPSLSLRHAIRMAISEGHKQRLIKRMRRAIMKRHAEKSLDLQSRAGLEEIVLDRANEKIQMHDIGSGQDLDNDASDRPHQHQDELQSKNFLVRSVEGNVLDNGNEKITHNIGPNTDDGSGDHPVQLQHDLDSRGIHPVIRLTKNVPDNDPDADHEDNGPGDRPRQHQDSIEDQGGRDLIYGFDEGYETPDGPDPKDSIEDQGGRKLIYGGSDEEYHTQDGPPPKVESKKSLDQNEPAKEAVESDNQASESDNSHDVVSSVISGTQDNNAADPDVKSEPESREDRIKKEVEQCFDGRDTPEAYSCLLRSAVAEDDTEFVARSAWHVCLTMKSDSPERSMCTTLVTRMANIELEKQSSRFQKIHRRRGYNTKQNIALYVGVGTAGVVFYVAIMAAVVYYFVHKQSAGEGDERSASEEKGQQQGYQQLSRDDLTYSMSDRMGANSGRRGSLFENQLPAYRKFSPPSR